MTLLRPKSQRKAKRDACVVTYVRVKAEKHALIAKIARTRGWPYTIASVTAEMITRGLKAETDAPTEMRP